MENRDTEELIEARRLAELYRDAWVEAECVKPHHPDWKLNILPWEAGYVAEGRG